MVEIHDIKPLSKVTNGQLDRNDSIVVNTDTYSKYYSLMQENSLVSILS